MKARENPFRSERVDALAYRAEGFCWQDLEDRLAAHGGRGAIVGPEGHGKTTLLSGWARRLNAQGDTCLIVRPALRQRALSGDQSRAVAAGHSVFIDGAGQLSRAGWRDLLQATRPAKRLVVTSHRPGLLPAIFQCHTSPALLDELVRDLTGAPAPDGLWGRHRGNIRLALRELYDACATT